MQGYSLSVFAKKSLFRLIIFFSILNFSKNFNLRNIEFFAKTVRLLPCRIFRISTILKMKNFFFYFFFFFYNFFQYLSLKKVQGYSLSVFAKKSLFRLIIFFRLLKFFEKFLIFVILNFSQKRQGYYLAVFSEFDNFEDEKKKSLFFFYNFFQFFKKSARL